jgi:hypothetical protein
VILHGRDPDRLQAAAATFPGAAGTLAFDVSDTVATKAAFETIGRAHGRLYILVNNAGIIPRKPLLETTDDDWASVIDSNLSASFRLSREAALRNDPAFNDWIAGRAPMGRRGDPAELGDRRCSWRLRRRPMSPGMCWLSTAA